MLCSMTGYARAQAHENYGSLIWEVKSVNHRYFETVFRLPEQFRYMEIAWRQLASKKLKRGKVDLILKFQASSEASTDFSVNQALLQRLSTSAEQLNQHFPNLQTETSQLLAWPGLLEPHEMDLETIVASASQVLETALSQLVEMRMAEGGELSEFFTTRLDKMHEHLDAIIARQPEAVSIASQRLRDRFAELSLEIDATRMEQELVWFAQKVDIAEEIKRLAMHIEAFEKAFKKGGVIGRRLDFLAQELNREANTLASKSIDATVTHSAIELKVLIEQIREQVQNIE